MQALKKLMLLTVVIASIIMCDFATGLTTKEIFEKHIEPKVTGITKDHEPTPPPKLPCAETTTELDVCEKHYIRIKIDKNGKKIYSHPGLARTCIKNKCECIKDTVLKEGLCLAKSGNGQPCIAMAECTEGNDKMACIPTNITDVGKKTCQSTGRYLLPNVLLWLACIVISIGRFGLE